MGVEVQVKLEDLYAFHHEIWKAGQVIKGLEPLRKKRMGVKGRKIIKVHILPLINRVLNDLSTLESELLNRS